MSPEGAAAANGDAFRIEMDRWWDALIAEGQRDKNPYAPDTALQDRIAALDTGSTERVLIDEVLIGWLLSDDVLRWQPALGNLTGRRVQAAVPAMRTAAAAAVSATKRSFAEDFLENAAIIESSARWIDVQAQLRALVPLASGILPGHELALFVDSIEEGDPDLAVYFGAHALLDDEASQSRAFAEGLLAVARIVGRAPAEEVPGLGDAEAVLEA